MSQENKIGSLEEEAMKRKERLKVFKRKQTVENSSESEKKDHTVLPKPKFRSYKPVDEALKENVIPDGKPSNIENEVKDQLAAAKNKIIIEELDIQNLAPRKPDWDLKRDVAKKLEILERRTQKAIAELIRERLKERQEDLASVINATTSAMPSTFD